MAHYARVVNGVVENVIIAEQEYIDNNPDIVSSEWVQTSYNTANNVHLNGGTPLRFNYAVLGGCYDADADVFYEQRPFDSWVLNTQTYLWEAPVACEGNEDEFYWSEDSLSWVSIV